MTMVRHIDSSIVGLRYTEEDSPGKAPASPAWLPLEPNSIARMGAQITTVVREPINPSRQRKKGFPTDLTAGCEFNMDLTQKNLQDLLQGYLFADARRKFEQAVASVAGTAKIYSVSSTTGVRTGSLVHGEGFHNPGNNGLKTVASVVSGVSVTVSEPLVDETHAAGARLVCVGHEFASGDAEIEVGAGAWPKLTTTAFDLTTLGLIPGEWIVIGSDNASNAFADDGNNGFKRILSISANEIEFDKSRETMTTDDGSGKSIRIVFGRVLRNEKGGPLVKIRTYQIEESLGAPDSSKPAEIQGQYIVGSLPSQCVFNVPAKDKATVDLSFVSEDAIAVKSTDGLKAGTRPDIEEQAAFNTSSNFYSKMALYTPGNAVPDPLFYYSTDLTLTLDNAPNPLPATGVFGAFAITSSSFAVSGSLTAYFVNIEAIQAVRQNSNVTLDFAFIAGNSGIVIDIPLLTLGDASLNVAQGEAITVPLTFDAFTGKELSKDHDYTIMFVFFDYLPDFVS